MTRFRFVALLLVTLGLCAGCSDDDVPTAPTTVTNQADADDVAVQAGIAFDDLRVFFNAITGVPPSPADTTFTRGSITFQLSRRWFDVDHVEQAIPDATTDSLVVDTRASGTDSTTFAPRYRITIGHRGQLRFGGFVDTRTVRTIEGATADTLDSRFLALSGDTRTFHSRVFGAATGIEVSKNGGYPTTGTIQWLLHAQRTVNGVVDKTLDATVTLQFNGTHHPILTVNGTWLYVVDFETGLVERVGST